MKRAFPSLIVVLSFLKQPVSALITWCIATKAAMQANPDLASPDVPFVDLQADIDAVQGLASQRVIDRSTNLTQQEILAIGVLYNHWTYMSLQIQKIANQKVVSSGSPAAGLDFIQGLGFMAKRIGIKPGRAFECYRTEAPGKAWLRCPAVGGSKAVYYWRFSTNPADPTAWSRPYATSISTVIFNDLQRDARHYFQFVSIPDAGNGTIIDADGDLDWSDAISEMIV